MTRKGGQGKEQEEVIPKGFLQSLSRDCHMARSISFAFAIPHGSLLLFRAYLCGLFHGFVSMYFLFPPQQHGTHQKYVSSNAHVQCTLLIHPLFGSLHRPSNPSFLMILFMSLSNRGFSFLCIYAGNSFAPSHHRRNSPLQINIKEGSPALRVFHTKTHTPPVN